MWSSTVAPRTRGYVPCEEVAPPTTRGDTAWVPFAASTSKVASTAAKIKSFIYVFILCTPNDIAQCGVEQFYRPATHCEHLNMLSCPYVGGVGGSTPAL